MVPTSSEMLPIWRSVGSKKVAGDRKTAGTVTVDALTYFTYFFPPGVACGEKSTARKNRRDHWDACVPTPCSWHSGWETAPRAGWAASHSSATCECPTVHRASSPENQFHWETCKSQWSAHKAVVNIRWDNASSTLRCYFDGWAAEGAGVGGLTEAL